MPHVIVVLGMHRGGTSALAGLLAASGAESGNPLLPANEGNPLGYWELAPVVALNNRLLALVKHRWHDFAPLPAGWQSLASVRELESVADDLLRGQFAHSRLVVLKDPRLCLTMPFWRRAIARLGWSLSLVAIARPLSEVIRSLQLRELMDPHHIAYLWARSMIEMARACFHDRALLLTYDQLLEAPKRVLGQISAKFEVYLDVESSERCVDGNLRHHGPTSPDDTPDAVPEALARFCAELYAAIAESAALGVTLGTARFRQAEAAMDALDRLLLPQVQQDAIWTKREEQTLLLREIDAARDSIAIMADEIGAARKAIDGLAQEITDARKAHLDRDRIEQHLRARLAELESLQHRALVGRPPSATDKSTTDP